MTLDKAIKHAEEVALRNEAICENAINIGVKNQTTKCANEHRQLAEWLKELQQYRELFGSPEEAEEVVRMIMV